ncbi:MAG: hypothetical protein HYS75_04460 [Nitrosopumilales archaeon]|nr:hypothetical protein [Nitrosopumilales archaeon]
MGFKRRNYRRSYRKNRNITYAIAIGSGIAGILGIIALFENYDITVANQKIEPLMPLKTVEQKFDEFYKTIPTESIESTVNDISQNIPIKIEQKAQKLEDKLLDCSKYKREYLEAHKNVRTTEDNTAAMMGEALKAVQQTRACEAYNDKVYHESGVLGHCKPPLIIDFKNEEDLRLSYKELFIKYCGQEEWDYINKQ